MAKTSKDAPININRVRSEFGSDALLLTRSSYDAPINRACSRSSFARPYIWRLMSFRRVI